MLYSFLYKVYNRITSPTKLSRNVIGLLGIILTVSNTLFYIGCSSELSYSISDTGATKFYAEYKLDGVPQNNDQGFLTIVDRPSFMAGNDTAIITSAIIKGAGLSKYISLYYDFLTAKFQTDNGLNKTVTSKLLKHVSHIGNGFRIRTNPGQIKFAYFKALEDPQWIETGTGEGRWKDREYIMKYDLISSFKKQFPYFRNNITQLNINPSAYKIFKFDKSFSRTGYFFNQLQTNTDTLFLSDIIKEYNADGYLGEIKTEKKYFTFWNTLHYLIPTIAVASIIAVKYNNQPDTIPYAAGIGIASWLALRFVLNIFLPHDLFYNINVQLVNINN